MKEKSEDTTRDLEKLITIRIIQEGAETISSLLKTERDPIFAMEIIPYYVLFVSGLSRIYGRYFRKKRLLGEINDIRNFIKDWNVHFNLGTYWTHIIGNTQMFADFLEIDAPFDYKIGMTQYEMGRQIGAFVASVREGISSNIQPPLKNRCHEGVNINIITI